MDLQHKLEILGVAGPHSLKAAPTRKGDAVTHILTETDQAASCEAEG